MLNYTTTVPPQRSIDAINKILVSGSARQIMTDYDESGSPKGVKFAIETIDGLRAFSLPIEVERVYQVLQHDDTPGRFCSKEQANRIAWRIMKDWLEAQLAIIKTEMVTFEQAMLPYMQSREGPTLYELYLRGDLPELGTGA